MAAGGKVTVNIESPAEFPFPFTPYDIQKDFMKSLFTTLNEG
jgi:chromosome transmission fidelity protein 1